jgi:hypothetical protein
MSTVRHKFSAVRTERDGQSFPSKLEARLYDHLVLEQRAGDVIFFLRQCPFHLPGGVVYRVDFQVFRADGTVEFLDAKGATTESFKSKRRQVETLYPVTIRTWPK